MANGNINSHSVLVVYVITKCKKKIGEDNIILIYNIILYYIIAVNQMGMRFRKKL